ncbi:alpha/beta hydrolase [Caulobacter segnis]|uniref:Alpha/beta hydrolase fold protein n=2 Tax=Caulobacter segnis TaxID=88688 RepID=D5VHZ1_CAUST|nr:alpha/beta hydrolase fold protein [Caulobacter segnis ATCC 21756]AVQ01057.1 alpha/beta hydrolase [Caulobacter segnis]
MRAGLNCALGALALCLATQAFAQSAGSITARVEDPAYAHAQRRVDLGGGRKLNLYCIGSGAPVVVFEAGLGDDTSTWGLVQPAIAKRTTACAYDRAGIGFSDPATRPSSASNIVDDLHHLLKKAGVKGPYVLVGHSYGGLTSALYASRYPKDVAAFVAVDPANERQVDAFREAFPNYEADLLAPALARKQDCVRKAERGFGLDPAAGAGCVDKPDPRMGDALNAIHAQIHRQPAYQRAAFSEFESMRGGLSGSQLASEIGSFGSIPLIVLTRPKDTVPLGPNETAQSRAILWANWTTMHDKLAARSTRGENRQVAATGHYIQLDQPGAVIDAIDTVLDAVAVSNTPEPK